MSQRRSGQSWKLGLASALAIGGVLAFYADYALAEIRSEFSVNYFPTTYPLKHSIMHRYWCNIQFINLPRFKEKKVMNTENEQQFQDDIYQEIPENLKKKSNIKGKVLQKEVIKPCCMDENGNCRSC